MARTINFLVGVHRMNKIFDSILKEVGCQYELTLIETKIISFLYNNPGRDTAADIVELRMLSKGNVSQAVESLIQKSLLERKPDISDRRKIHLALLPEALPITEEIEKRQTAFYEELFEGVSREEWQFFERINDHVLQNANEILRRREES